MTEKQLYDNRYAKGYRSELSGFEVARLQAIEHLAKNILKLDPKGKVLDYGCGSGLHVDLWEKIFDNAQLYFADISSVALEQLVDKNPSHRDRTGLILDNKVEFADKSFDVVTSIEVLEHVDDLKAYLSEILRVLKPGGHFIWTTPCGNSFSIEHIYSLLTGQIEPTAEGYRRWKWEEPTHVRRIKTSELQQVMLELGYSDIKFKFRSHFFSFVCTRLCRGPLRKMGEKLMNLDYILFRNLPNGASMVASAQRPH